MIVKLKEVYRDVSPTASPMLKMRYETRDIFINPEHVIYVRKNPSMSKRLSEGLINGLEEVEFCTISVSRGSSGTDIIVVGTLDEVNKKLSKGAEVLYG